MIIVIQVSLILLSCFVFWCEQTKFFANTVKSILIRLFFLTSLIGICYHVPCISTLDYLYQFVIMTCVILLTFVTVLITLKRYEHNKNRHSCNEVIVR